jgi:galactonate dehydratase
LGLKDQVAEIKGALNEGFTAFKSGPGPLVQPFDDRKLAEMAISLYRELRAAAGMDCDLMIDCAGIFSLQAAHRLIEGLRETGMLFVEEPVNMDTPRGLVELRRAFPGMRIAAGERQMTRWGFREWLEQGAVDVIQADISHCGGIGELLRIASWAEVYNVQMAPHNPYGPVALAANTHACAVMQNFLILEHCRHRPWFNEVQKYGPHVVEGCVLLSDRPGLGIELDWDYVKKHPYYHLPLRTFTDRDGAMPSV